MELPCNHADVINQLEVHLKSKQNELAHLRQHLSHLQHSNDTEHKQREDNLAKIVDEVRTLKKQTIYTEANVLAFQKLNAVRGDLIDREKTLATIQAELTSLRNIKKAQSNELEKQTIIKNFPDKIASLIDEVKHLQQKHRYIEEQMKVIEETKKLNFEEIIQLED